MNRFRFPLADGRVLLIEAGADLQLSRPPWVQPDAAFQWVTVFEPIIEITKPNGVERRYVLDHGRLRQQHPTDERDKPLEAAICQKLDVVFDRGLDGEEA